MGRAVKRKPRPKCATPYCRNPSAVGKSKCAKCRSRELKAKHPEAYTLNILRFNARRLGKAFDLTLAQFKQWCADTGYMEMKGQAPNAYTIDRIDDARGYTLDNIRVLTMRENVQKERARQNGKQYDDVPF